MKNLLLSTLCVFVFSLAKSQSVSIAATNGGSVTLTPEGVTRTAAPVTTRGIASVTPKAPTPSPKAVSKAAKNPDGQLINYSFTISSTAEARMIFNCYRGMRDDENASAADLANYDALRKYIVDTKDLASTKKTLTIDIPADRVDRIFYSGGYWNKKELQRQLKVLEVEEKLFQMASKQETDANVPEEKSKLRWQKQKYEQ